MTTQELKNYKNKGCIFRLEKNPFTNNISKTETRVYLTESDCNPFYGDRAFKTVKDAENRLKTYKHPENWHIFKVWVNNFTLYDTEIQSTMHFAYITKKIF